MQLPQILEYFMKENLYPNETIRKNRHLNSNIKLNWIYKMSLQKLNQAWCCAMIPKWLLH